jgi:hypothetical protein
VLVPVTFYVTADVSTEAVQEAKLSAAPCGVGSVLEDAGSCRKLG